MNPFHSLPEYEHLLSDADYDAAFVGDPVRAEAAVASAKDFVARVEQLLSHGGGG